jgi:hypothetical protein
VCAPYFANQVQARIEIAVPCAFIQLALAAGAQRSRCCDNWMLLLRAFSVCKSPVIELKKSALSVHKAHASATRLSAFHAAQLFNRAMTVFSR